MNAPAFPPNPTFNQQFGNWVWSGSRWVCTNTNGVRIVTQVFRASAPYMPSPGLISAVVECIGGGGGGGEASVPAATYIVSGGGGGSGGYSRITLASGLVLGGVNVTIGGGGGQQAAGGATSFGAMCVANGGLGGQGNVFATGATGQGGNGGAPGIGDVAFPGADGACGFAFVQPTVQDAFLIAGAMGGALYGGAHTFNIGPTSQTAGSNATANTGAGGSGAAINQNPAGPNVAGGNGAAGICTVTEYCFADTFDSGCGCGSTSGQARVAAGWQGGFDND